MTSNELYKLLKDSEEEILTLKRKRKHDSDTLGRMLIYARLQDLIYPNLTDMSLELEEYRNGYYEYLEEYVGKYKKDNTYIGNRNKPYIALNESLTLLDKYTETLLYNVNLYNSEIKEFNKYIYMTNKFNEYFITKRNLISSLIDIQMDIEDLVDNYEDIRKDIGNLEDIHYRTYIKPKDVKDDEIERASRLANLIDNIKENNEMYTTTSLIRYISKAKELNNKLSISEELFNKLAIKENVELIRGLNLDLANMTRERLIESIKVDLGRVKRISGKNISFNDNENTLKTLDDNIDEYINRSYFYSMDSTNVISLIMVACLKDSKNPKKVENEGNNG